MWLVYTLTAGRGVSVEMSTPPTVPDTIVQLIRLVTAGIVSR